MVFFYYFFILPLPLRIKLETWKNKKWWTIKIIRKQIIIPGKLDGLDKQTIESVLEKL